MKNIFFKKIIVDFYKTEHLTLKDFIDICDMLELPVFEVAITHNSYAEPQGRTVTAKMYDSMSEYRKTMPDWSARAYDYENDRATYYLEYPDIANGEFEINDSNNSSRYLWHFEVAGECVVVHSHYSIT